MNVWNLENKSQSKQVVTRGKFIDLDEVNPHLIHTKLCEKNI